MSISSQPSNPPAPELLPAAPDYVQLNVGYIEHQAIVINLPTAVLYFNAAQGKRKKYLCFVAASICGQHGNAEHSVVRTGPSNDHVSNAEPEAGDVWEYRVDGVRVEMDQKVVDMHYLEGRSTLLSSTRRSRRQNGNHTFKADKPRDTNFPNKIKNRDGACVFTGEGEEDCDAMHIVPHTYGSKCIQYIDNTRERENGTFDRTEIGQSERHDADLPVNGLFAAKGVHSKFGRGFCYIVKTPNKILDMDDIPRSLLQDASHASHEALPSARYTVQYCGLPTRVHERRLPPNTDARFSSTRDPKTQMPSAKLLHYQMGYALLKYHGVTNIILENAPFRFVHPPRTGSDQDDDGDDDYSDHAELDEDSVDLADEELDDDSDQGQEMTRARRHGSGYGRVGEDGRIDAFDIINLMGSWHRLHTTGAHVHKWQAKVQVSTNPTIVHAAS
ncbi:hypothetical protein DACRYDRAFT_119595 [Dacryopinax primogenitus]|uniref:HNH nuclease domain-containing protein n=1 Tax=Dacryopinax primogenitus (strain DJM 731) TaxID=1858805 RepID=M5FQR7_DACPD|nr:uncharacterized protein DACRYDRAFT_119595 [Dacryopinax primogenitus]EJT97114.1 hypothetical protein DACRYDRAFT_119595 [Dacryopinax primogenitus]